MKRINVDLGPMTEEEVAYMVQDLLERALTESLREETAAGVILDALEGQEGVQVLVYDRLRQYFE